VCMNSAYRQGRNLLIPQTNGENSEAGQTKVLKLLLEGRNLALSHLFQVKGKPGDFFSYYDPDTQIIQREADGKVWDRKEGSSGTKYGMEVKRVLVLGSNYLMWRKPYELNKLNLADAAGKALQAPLFPYNNSKWRLAKPTDSDMLAYMLSLDVYSVLMNNRIPAILFHSPSDMPPRGVPNVLKTREKYKKGKIIHRSMKAEVRELGLSNLLAYSNSEILNNESIKKEISEGNGIWYALESEFRTQADKLLTKLTKKNGLADVVDEYFPGGKNAWDKKNAQKQDSWEVTSSKGSVYLNVKRKSRQAIKIRIGTENGPKCPLFVCTMLMKAHENFGISHLMLFTNENEIAIVNTGFTIARRVLALPVNTYSISIGEQTMTSEGISPLRIEYSARNGRGAFINRLRDPLPDITD